MTAKVGDTLRMTAKTKRLAPNQRVGVIEEILDATQPRYLVRWGDGRTTVIAPLPGSYRVEPTKPARRSAAWPKPAAKAPVARKPAAKKPGAQETLEGRRPASHWETRR